MPAGFEFPQWAELWQPLWPTPGLVDHARDQRTVRAVGRLEDGVTVTRAQADLAAVAAGLAATYPETNEGFRPRVDPFNEHYNGTFRPVLTALMFAAGIVLLVACANAANLLLARAARRSREVGMRVSLGATRARIVRQLLVECLVLAGLAGVLGLGLAVLCAHLLSMSFEPLMAPFWIDFAIDGRVLAFLTVTCLSTSLLFGLAPALHTSKANVRDIVKPAGQAGTGRRPLRGWMWWLVPAELALTLVLLAGAGLMARSLLTLALADRIIDSAGVTSIQLLLPEARATRRPSSVWRSSARSTSKWRPVRRSRRRRAPARSRLPRWARRPASSPSIASPHPTATHRQLRASPRSRTTTSRRLDFVSSGAARSPTATEPRVTTASSSTGASRICSSGTTIRSAGGFA